MELTLQLGLGVKLKNRILGYNPCFYGINFAIFLKKQEQINDYVLQSLFLWN